LYFFNFVATVFNEPVLWRFLKFQISNLMSVFGYLGRAKEYVLVRGCLQRFVTNYMFSVAGSLAPLPPPKLEGHPLSAVRDCLFNLFAATLHI
jgi:hypothetical protein